MIKAIILAAGRGERMRPLSDHCPKPLLKVGGQALIVWIIQNLARAGLKDIVINHAWLGEQFEQTLGDGSAWGVRLHYSAESSALETAGGITHALPLLGQGVFLAVSADIYTDFNFSHLLTRATFVQASAVPLMHLVLVDNPDFHPHGDFYLLNGKVQPLNTADAIEHPEKTSPMQTYHKTCKLFSDQQTRSSLTYANIGLYDSRSFMHLDPNTPAKLAPLIHNTMAHQCVSGEYFQGVWHNIGNPRQLDALNQTLLHQS